MASLSATNQKLTADNHQLNQKSVKLSASLSRSEDLIEKLNIDLNTAANNEAKNKDIVMKLRKQIDNASQERAELETKLAVLNPLFEKSKKELKQALDTIDYLTHEKTILLQEKSMIQGECNQLQKLISEVAQGE